MRVAVLLLAGACFDPHAQTGIPCGAATRACPSGQRCNAEGFCEVNPTDTIDASVVDTPMIPGDTRPDPGWYSVTSMPAARSLTCAVAAGGRLYVIGGSLMTVPRNDVWFTTIADNGMLGAWTETTKLPSTTKWHACAIHEPTASLYVIGGDLGVPASTIVLRAPITPTGLGAWDPMPALPAGRRGHGAFIAGDHVYVLGGEEGNGFLVRDTIYIAAIASDGKLGAWATSATKLPVADYEFGTAASAGTVFLSGGYKNHTKVHRAAIGTGTLATFASTTDLPGSRERHVSVALDGFVYVMGGEATYATPNIRTVVRAPIAGGALGSWVALPDMPEALAYASVASDSRGYIYVVGGSTDTGQVANVQLLVPP